jgi:cell division protein FtsB
MTNPHPLAAARRADTDRRRTRVQQALAELADDPGQISISSVAARAGVHRSFLHRHPDLHAAVLAAQQAMPAPRTQSATTSAASLRADNANLAERNRRLQQHIHVLEDRLSDLLGEQTHHRSGLGAPPATAAIEQELEELRQRNLDLQRTLEERDEELGAIREAYRRLMADRNRNPSRC